MRILLFGKNGQVGKALAPLLVDLGDLILIGHEDLDVTDSNKLRGVLRTHKPDLVINTSAYTNVDRAEIEKDIAWRVNAEAPGVMMEELNKWKGTLIHFSTDYVFDGVKNNLYVEDDALNPINEYGRTKLDGEKLIEAIGDRYLIMRTSWVYALDSQNFVSNVVLWATTKEALRVVDDQIGSPTWAGMLAEKTAELLYRRNPLEFIQENAGIYHFAGKGAVSRYDLAKKILSLIPPRIKSKATVVIPGKSIEFPSPALRPGYSALDCTKIEKVFDVSLPPWDVSLFYALQRLRI